MKLSVDAKLPNTWLFTSTDNFYEFSSILSAVTASRQMQRRQRPPIRIRSR